MPQVRRIGTGKTTHPGPFTDHVGSDLWKFQKLLKMGGLSK